MTVLLNCLRSRLYKRSCFSKIATEYKSLASSLWPVVIRADRGPPPLAEAFALGAGSCFVRGGCAGAPPGAAVQEGGGPDGALPLPPAFPAAGHAPLFPRRGGEPFPPEGGGGGPLAAPFGGLGGTAPYMAKWLTEIRTSKKA